MINWVAVEERSCISIRKDYLNGQEIARVPFGRMGAKRGEAVQYWGQANARAIAKWVAAAPRMWEALRAVNRSFEGEDHVEARLVKAALAKAEEEVTKR